MKPKVIFGSIAGVAVMLVGIGGTWVILNFDAVAAKLLEAGVKFAAKRGVQLSPETVKLLLELSGGTAGATAGAAGKATAKTGQRAASKATSAGSKARQTSSAAAKRAPKPARSAS